MQRSYFQSNDKAFKGLAADVAPVPATTTTRQLWRYRACASMEPAFWSRWDKLNARYNAIHPMLDARFVRGCCDHFRPRVPLAALECSEYGEVRALVLLDAPAEGGCGTQRVFMPSQLQLAPVIAAPGFRVDTRAFFAAFPAWVQRCDFFNLDPDYFGTASFGHGAVDADLYGVTMRIDASVPFEAYWAARPTGLRQNIRRYIKRVEADGMQVAVKCHRDAHAIASALLRYGDLESRGWKGEAGTAIHEDNEQGRFYADVVGRFGATDDALAFELYFGDELVASRICITAGSMAVMLKTTYNETYSRHSPGRILLYHALERLFAREGVRSIEFYTNASKDQLQWCDTTREISNASVYRTRVALAAARAIKTFRGTATDTQRFRLDVCEQFGDLPKDARRLWSRCGTDSFFQSLEWYENLYRNVGNDLGALRVLILRNSADECQAIFPMVLTPRHRGVRELCALSNYYSPDFVAVVDAGSITREEAIRRVVAALCATNDWDRLRFYPLHDGGDIPAFVTAGAAALRPAFLVPKTANWSLDIEDLAAYWQTRPSQLKSILRRKTAKLQRERTSRFEIARGTDDALDTLIADYTTVYRESWKTAEPYPDFIRGVAELAAKSGCLRLGILYIDDEPAAAQLWMVWHGTALIYKLAYSRKFTEYSSGSLLTKEMLEYVVTRDGVTRVDFLTGDDAFKRNWMSTRKPMYDLTITNTATVTGCFLTFYNVLGSLRRRFGGRAAHDRG